MSPRFRQHLLPLAVLIALSGCGDAGPSSGLRVVQMSLGNRTFQIEVANTDASREKGLMQRDSMPEDHGMIFVFNKAEVLQFWMKNTRFALDIVYLDGNGKIVSIKQMKPYVLDAVPSDVPAQYAIELNKGVAAAVGLKVGDMLKIPSDTSLPP